MTVSREHQPESVLSGCGTTNQQEMLGYYRKSKIVSESNTEYLRVVLARELVEKYALPLLAPRPKDQIVLVDIGCSVGLMAIEFAKAGFHSFGVDLDPAALEIAARLNEEERTRAAFLQKDVADWDLDIPIDIALCFDIFEHLQDDQIGALLFGLKRKLSPRGSLVFHTLPLQYDYLFWQNAKGIIRFPPLLRLFKNVRPKRFTGLVEIYAQCRDVLNLCRGRPTHKENIASTGHCNPLTRRRLEGILFRAGYEVVHIQSGFLGEVQLDPRDRQYFHRQPVTHRSLRGVAVVRR